MLPCMVEKWFALRLWGMPCFRKQFRQKHYPEKNDVVYYSLPLAHFRR